MMITLTDDNGTVFAIHRLGAGAAAVLLDRVQGAWRPNDRTDEERQAAESAYADLQTALRNEEERG